MRTALTILLLAAAIGMHAQSGYDPSKITRSTKNIVSKIAAVNELMGSAVYYEGRRPKQFDYFVELEKTASKQELLALTDYPNAVVRCYACWALTHDSTVDLFPVIIRHLNDDSLVFTQFGCIGSSQAAGDFFIELVTPELIDLEAKKLPEEKRRLLDSFLLFVPNRLQAKSWALQRADTSGSLYERIRELAIKAHDQEAMVSLARYRKARDIPFILDNPSCDQGNTRSCYYTWRAIAAFPDPAFFPMLEGSLGKTLDKTHYSNEWRELYNAIAAYQNENAVRLLTIPFTGILHQDFQVYHINYIYEAIRNRRIPVYQELLWRLWAEEGKITPDVFACLLALDHTRAYEITKKSLSDAGLALINAGQYFNEDDSSGNIIDKMLDLVGQQDTALYRSIIIRNIKKAAVLEFQVYASRVSARPDTAYIEPLLERIEQEDNAYVYLEATKILIAYHSPAINQRILAIKKTNPALTKDWGGKDFMALLKENGIY